MTRVHIDHFSLCVRDLDRAIEDWKDILDVLMPEMTETITRSEGSSDGTAMVWATFQNPDPTGVSVQMWAPGDAGPGAFFESVGFKVIGQTPFGENLGALDL